MLSAERYGLDPYDPEAFLQRLSEPDRAAAHATLRASFEGTAPSPVHVALDLGDATYALRFSAHPWNHEGKNRVLLFARDVAAPRQPNNEHRLLAEAVRQSSEGVAIIEMSVHSIEERRVVYVNDALCTLLETDRDDLMTNGLARYIFLDNAATQLDELLRSFQKGLSAKVTSRARTKTGRNRWIATSTYPLKQCNSDKIAVVALYHDLTERKESGQTIALLQAIVAEAEDLVVLADATPIHDGGPKIRFINPALAALLGTHPEALVGTSLFRLVSPKADVRARDSMARHFRAKTPLASEILLRRGDGTDVWVQGTGRPLFDENGVLSGWLCMARDMTLRKLQFEQTAELTAALDTNERPTTIYKVIDETTIEPIYDNAAAATRRSHALAWLLRDEDQRKRIDWRRLKRGETVKVIVRHRASDAEQAHWLTIDCKPVFSYTGDLQSIVTTEKSLEESSRFRRPRPSAEAATLAEELFSFADYAERADGLTAVVRQGLAAETNLSFCASPAMRVGELTLHSRESMSVTVPAGAFSDKPVLIEAISQSQFTDRQITALRVFFETIVDIATAQLISPL